MNMNITDYPELAGDIERRRRERKTWAGRAAESLWSAIKRRTRKWKR